jgi:PAS domain S-box-containing protein
LSLGAVVVFALLTPATPVVFVLFAALLTSLFGMLRHLHHAPTVQQPPPAARPQHAEAHYQNLFEHAPDGIFQVSPVGQFLSANPALAHILGYDTPQEVLRSVRDIAAQVFVHPWQWDDFVALLHEYGTVSGFELQARCKDGRLTWIALYARAISDQQGALCYYEGFMRDIADRKSIEQLLVYNSFRDELTGLANRAQLTNRLDTAIRYARQQTGSSYAILAIDCDHFHRINHRLGPLVG